MRALQHDVSLDRQRHLVSDVPVLILRIEGIFGISWRDAVFGRNDCAVIAFAIFLILMGYLPANSQITLAPDHLFALAAWVYAWRRTRRRAAEPTTPTLAPRPAA